MKFRLHLAFAALLLGNITFGQIDANAKKILDNVSNKVKSYSGIIGSFSIKSITSKGKNNGSKTGTITLKGKKYILKQGKTEIVCDAINIYNYDGVKTVTVTPVEESSSTLSPQNLLSNFYDKDFSYKLVNSTGSYYQIELYPNDKRKNYSKVTVFVDKKKDMITKAKILDKTSNTIEFSLNNLNTSANIKDNSFVFNKSHYPSNVEILD
jgi:outer membrane lipoprotein carrier protein